jgi:hypothetical protein
MKAVLMILISLGLTLRLMLLPGEGLIDLDCPYIEKPKLRVNLAGLPLFLATKIIGTEEPEVSEFLAGIKAIKIRIYDQTALSGRKFAEVVNFYKEQLHKPEWESLVSVTDEESRIGVYSLTKQDVIRGLLILVGESEELVVVNLAGRIDISKLSEIDEITGVNLNLPELSSGR